MRIKVTFKNELIWSLIPLNYNYYLTSAIYDLIRDCNDQIYSDFSRNHGYELEGKNFKLFTYSQLLVGRRKILNHQMALGSKFILWMVSSPVEEFIYHLSNRLSKINHIEVAGYPLIIDKIETMDSEEIYEEMRFRCLSPITVSDQTAGYNRNFLRYCRLGEKFYQRIRENLINKYRFLYHHDPPDTSLEFRFIENYIRKRNQKITKLIHFQQRKILAYLSPFYVKGNKELITLGYECGFGEKNAMGFGMVDFLKSRKKIKL